MSSRTSRIRVGVAGASGYAGEDLVRLLLAHPDVELTVATSRQQAGRSVAEAFPRFAHASVARNLRFEEPDAGRVAERSDVVFLALPHGVAAEYAAPLLEKGRRVIDLSADFRIKSAAVYEEFYGRPHPEPGLLAEAVYGLPELRREEIASARLVACPGCYPTSILIPLIPLLREGLVDPERIIADSMSGVTGAGRKLEAGYLFAECNESLRPYGVPKHRHLSEIEQELTLLAGRQVVVQFTPHLVPVNRGILTTLYLEPASKAKGEGLAEIEAARVEGAYRAAYENEPFVRLLSGGALPDTKNVTGSNFLDLAWRIDPRTRRLIVMSAEDNLVKGTSGQAIQCLNLMHGLKETTGLM